MRDTTILSRGAFLTKEAPPIDDKIKEAGLEKLAKDMSDAVTHMTKFKTDYEADAKVLKELRDKVESLGSVDAETKAALQKTGTDLAESLTKLQACEQAIETLKKEMDQPIFRGDKDLKDHDRENAIALQRRAHIHKGGTQHDFVADLDNLVNPADYRSAVHKLMSVGTETKAGIMRQFSEAERKAFDAASLDSGFFSPELLGIEVDCEIECASLLDLYQQISVSRSTFMFPHVESYGDIGQYDCDAKCDAEYGPEGNITWKNGQTYDFRGVFCFQRDTLREANYDLLGFMMRAAARSYRINRNQALITGDGVNEPMGWLTADCFTKLQTPAANPTHQDLRQFLASAPVEYGPVTATMHQNVFAYFASMVDNTGRFIFGDGLMGFSPNDVRDSIRISNCLPDATAGGTLGSADDPFVAGDFILAAGVWERAYAAVNHRPMFMEQYEGGSSAWCVKYQFGAKDGGFVACCPAARTLTAGAGG
jgi:hypothetical protein